MNTKIIIAGIVLVVAVIVFLNVWKPSASEIRETTEPTATAVASASASPAPAGPPTPTPKISIQTLTSGKGFPVKTGDTVSVLYVGKLTDGTVFDESAKHNNVPMTFVLGVDRLIEGFTQGVLGMKLGEKRRITIPPELGYGAAGVPQANIPANATLVFDVDLKAINPPSATPTIDSKATPTPK